MPELPEVETIRTSLEPCLVNARIVAVDIREARLRWPVVAADFSIWVVGNRIVSVTRRAKYLVWQLDNGAAILIHLGMSGRLAVFAAESWLENHTHLIFHLDNATQVRYRDPRRFGFVEVVPPEQLGTWFRFKNLGVEPLSLAFDQQFVARSLKKSKKPIKNWIMDAQNIVGVGNIYANEALFKAGIHPARPANSLKNDEQRRLVESVKSVLTAAINKGGTTLNDFRNAQSEPGFFQLDLAVYQNAGQVCGSCGAVIERIVMSGRSTFYCPSCQR